MQIEETTKQTWLAGLPVAAIIMVTAYALFISPSYVVNMKSITTAIPPGKIEYVVGDPTSSLFLLLTVGFITFSYALWRLAKLLLKSRAETKAPREEGEPELVNPQR